MQAVYAKKALKYALLPEIAPRMTRLFGSGFGMLAYLIASIYGMARLLPKTHPYLNTQNIGRFSIRQVIAEAANNLVVDRKNIDQIVVFGAVLAGVLLLILQFILLFYMLFMGSAHAQISTLFTGSIFNTPDPTNDIALKMLDRVFGIPQMFCNTGGLCTTINATLPMPMHTGLHKLFEFYSYAMLLVGVLIFLYFVVVVVTETAVSGHPFGQRFQNVWVPIRLVVALGLLVPINYGYNSGQYIALYSAKMGSALATNGWMGFNKAISDKMGDDANPSGEKKEAMVGIPKGSSIAGLVQAMSLIHACAYAEWTDAAIGFKSDNYLAANFPLVKPYFVKNPQGGFSDLADNKAVTSGTTYVEALDFYNNADIVIRFGWRDGDYFPSEAGNVYPLCGEIQIPVSSVVNKGQGGTMGGPDQILQTYFDLVKNMWFNSPALYAGAVRFTEVLSSADPLGAINRACGVTAPGLDGNCATTSPGAAWKQNLVTNYQSQLNTQLMTAWNTYVANKQDYKLTQEILNLGWGGSSIWYNRVAEINGAFLTAAMGVPTMIKYPLVMEKALAQKKKLDANISEENMFVPNFSIDTKAVAAGDLMGTSEAKRAGILSTAYNIWSQEGADQTSGDKKIINNAFHDAMSIILGVDGIFNIRKDNAHVHPLAQLSMIGKGMVERTIRNMAISNTSAFMGGFSKAVGYGGAATLIEAVGGIFSMTAFLGLTIGVTLYYILPFLPFIFFFFAVGAWVKSIFEAMVGIPLWALAHLRLDGEGLAGESASSGYFLILEIGLRPILIVFGLVAAIIIFTAQVRILNYTWDLVSENAAGFSDHSGFTIGAPNTGKELSFKRNVVDQFAYTVIYTIIVYMLANSSFKLIDLIPNEAMRWIGSNATSYAKQEQNAQTVQGLQSAITSTGLVQGQQLMQQTKGLSEGLGNLGGTAITDLGGGLSKFLGTKP